MHASGYPQVFTYNTPAQLVRYLGLSQINLNRFATKNTNPVMSGVLAGSYIGEYK
jgi:hypothetical protein